MWSSKAYVDHHLAHLEILQRRERGILYQVERRLFGRNLISPRLSVERVLIKGVSMSFISAVAHCLTGGVNTILDVGGGGGDNYMLCRRYLPPSRLLNWVVSDNATLWGAAAILRSLFLAPGDSLKRIEMLDKCDPSTDLLILNGTLQYLPSIEWLFQQFGHRPNSIVLNRTVFSQDPTHTVRQKAMVGEVHGQNEFFLQNTVYNESDLVNQFLRQGYVVLRHSAPLRYSLSTDQDSIEGYYRTITFVRT